LKPISFIKYIFFTYLIAACFLADAQEMTGPLRWNPILQNVHSNSKKTAKKTTAALSLPFFEDFTYYTPYPDSNKWVDFEAFINNTMGRTPVSWGVATLDDLNQLGLPYDSFSNNTTRYCDSLTSRPIDISANTVGDSLYLSFFYQAQGNGFYPQPEDSLQLYFKNKYGDYELVWSVPGPDPGALVQPFQIVMIPVTDTLDFHGSFQFRFVNIAALNWSDAVWNVDYIKLDKNRTLSDTTVSDVGFTCAPGYLLNDYTYMPYNQFKANPNSEIVSTLFDSIRNDTSYGQTVNFSFTVKDSATNIAGSAGSSSIFLSGYQANQVNEPFLPFGFPSHPANSVVNYQVKFFIDSDITTGPTDNDTVVRNQVFDNYLAYDDGTAEKSYYLELSTSLPGKISIEYHLNQPDTLRALAIYFGRQIPFANFKPFYIEVYSALYKINGDTIADVPLYSSLTPQNPAYTDSINHFWIYTLDTPIGLPAGVFYAGTMQDIDDGSDSLYYGLDVNRIGSNHAYFNVDGNWTPSTIGGAIMIRPILGNVVSGSYVKNVQQSDVSNWQLNPNPVSDFLKFEFGTDQAAQYILTDVMGHTLMTGSVFSGKSIDLEELPPGMYFVSLRASGISPVPKKIIRL